MLARSHAHLPGPALAVLLVALVLCIGAPCAGIAYSLSHLDPANAEATSTRPFSAEAILTTFLACASIALLATLLALPAAWTLRRASAAWHALFAVPLLMPTYLAYAGWGVLRGPGSALGEFLSRGDPVRVQIADRLFAVGGLALWSWPIAAFLIAAAARQIPGSLLDTLDIEPAPPWHRLSLLSRLLLPSITASFALIFLITAGSAIPLHLAQVQTYAIHLWTFMSLTPEPSRVWFSAWPLVLFALAAAYLCVRGISSPNAAPEDQGDPRSRSPSLACRAVGLTVWALSIPVPIALFASSLHSGRSLLRFWSESGRAVAHSSLVAGIVGAACVLLFLCAWWARTSVSLRARSSRNQLGADSGSHPHGSFRALGAYAVSSGHRISKHSTFAFLTIVLFAAAALVPGNLIGNATASFWNARFLPRKLGDSDLPLILAHITRFAFLPLLAGWWLGTQESPEHRDSRLLFAPGIRGWWQLRVLANPSAPLGIALGGAALSLHEIEATVLLQPPGSANLAQRLLDLLHYARNEQLAAAAVNMLVLGTALALAASFLLSRAFTIRASTDRF